jgi:excisionase family DNA binding protein
MDGWLTTRDAAAELGYSEEYVRRLARNDRIDASKFGNIWLIKTSEVEEIKERLAQQEELGFSKNDPRRGSFND